ncbi:MAG: class I SAM-dependent methyltransferase [bacterium]|nr:class I SAM-dependent methyltransferase [bacterium]
MNQDKDASQQPIKPEELPELSKKDKELLSKIVRLEEILPQELHEQFFAYMAAGRAKDDSELYELLPEEIIQHVDHDYSDLALDFFEQLGDKPDQTIVQVGCGRADLLMNMAKLGFTNLYGVDRTQLQVEGANRKLAEAGVSERVTMIQALVQEYDYSKIGKKIDVAIINNFWGIIDPDSSIKLIKLLHKNLTDNGKLYMGPIRIKPEDKKPSILKMYWFGLKQLYYVNKVKRKFGIKMIYPIDLDFNKYGFKTNLLHFKNADYHYYLRYK